jgi:hypothetical protein
MKFVEFNPLDKLGLRQYRLPFGYRSTAKGESKNMPEPLFTLGG